MTTNRGRAMIFRRGFVTGVMVLVKIDKLIGDLGNKNL